jgi:hypothetical protein
MAHTIKLTRNHQRILIEALAISLEIKEIVLSKKALETANRYYLDAAEKIKNNDIECGRTGKQPRDNLFAWLRDQFYHSGSFEKTELGKLAIAICEAASYNEYDTFIRTTIMNTLFE